MAVEKQQQQCCVSVNTASCCMVSAVSWLMVTGRNTPVAWLPDLTG